MPLPCWVPATGKSSGLTQGPGQGVAGRGLVEALAREEMPRWGQKPSTTVFMSLNTGVTGGPALVTATLSVQVLVLASREQGVAAASTPWVCQMVSDTPQPSAPSSILRKAPPQLRVSAGGGEPLRSQLPPSRLACVLLGSATSPLVPTLMAVEELGAASSPGTREWRTGRQGRGRRPAQHGAADPANGSWLLFFLQHLARNPQEANRPEASSTLRPRAQACPATSRTK